MAKLLTKIEEHDLILAAQSGDLKARDRVILANMGLCWKWARKFHRPSWMDLDDLVHEGVKGLNNAIRKFDVTRGYKFSTYAVCWIRQAMQRATERTRHHMNVPAQANARLIKIDRAHKNLSNMLGRKPTVEEVAEETGLSIKVIMELEPARIGTLSTDVEYDHTAYDTKRSGTTLHDYILEDNTPDFRDQIERNILIEEYLSILPDNLRTVLIFKYGLYGETAIPMRQIAKIQSVSHECIRLRENRALRKIREYISTQESDA